MNSCLLYTSNLPCAWALHDKDVYTQSAFDAYVKKHEGTLPDWMPGDLKKPQDVYKRQCLWAAAWNTTDGW